MLNRDAGDEYERLLDLADAGSYHAGIDHCFSVLDNGDIDRGFWTLQIGLLYFLNFWERGELFEEAPRFVEQAVWLNPDDAEAHFWFGHVSEVSFKDVMLARREYETCLQLEPGHVLAHLSLAALNLPPEEAKQHIAEVLLVQPSNYRALMIEADICGRLRDDDGEIRALNTLLDRSAYEEPTGGIMNRYINTELNFSLLTSRIEKEARKRLAAFRRPR